MVWTSVLVCSALRTAEPQAAPVSALSSLAMAGAVAAAVARVTLESLLPRGRGVVTLHHLRTCALESSCPIQVLAPTLTSCLTLGKLLFFFFKLKFILFERQRDRNLPSADSFSKCLQQPEAQNSIQFSYMGGQIPTT